MNASIFASMPPYLVGAAPSLSADWLTNPDPDLYGSWNEFAKQLLWDYQAAGEVFVLVTARYSTEWPARFHVVPPWMVDVEMDRRVAAATLIGGVDVTADMLHIRYKSRTGDAHGHGPLEVGRPPPGRRRRPGPVRPNSSPRPAASRTPCSPTPTSSPPHQSADLQAQWVTARMSSLGLPAVLSGGVEFETLQFNPTDMALVELSGVERVPDRCPAGRAAVPRRPARPAAIR